MTDASSAWEPMLRAEKEWNATVYCPDLEPTRYATTTTRKELWAQIKPCHTWPGYDRIVSAEWLQQSCAQFRILAYPPDSQWHGFTIPITRLLVKCDVGLTTRHMHRTCKVPLGSLWGGKAAQQEKQLNSNTKMKIKTNLVKIGVLAASIILGAPTSRAAVDFGANITIWDGVNTFSDPFTADELLFPGVITPTLQPPVQAWDVEGLFLSQNCILSMVGGYDFVNGTVQPGSGHFTSGDLFIDLNDDAVWGNDGFYSYLNNHYLSEIGLTGHYWYSTFQTNNFGYDYVIHFARKADGITLDLVGNQIAFDVYRIDPSTLVETVLYYHRANPWRYLSGGTKVNASPLYATYTTGLSDADTGFLGDAQVGPNSHKVLQLDLSSFLTADEKTNMFFHYTYECGNDLLIGKGGCVTEQPKPCIGVEKKVACALPGDNCSAFAKIAAGYKGQQDPAFCYEITVRNCGQTELTDVVVLDDKLGDLTTTFFGAGPATLPAGASITRYYKSSWAVDTTNTVTVAGQSAGAVAGPASSSAVALVLPASIVCQAYASSPDDQDGNPNNDTVTLVNNGTPHVVTFKVTVHNPGAADLVNVTIWDALLASLGCQLPAPFALPAGTSREFTLCALPIYCTNAPLVNTVQVSGTVDVANGGCGYAADGQPVLVGSQCAVRVVCTEPPQGCTRTIGYYKTHPSAIQPLPIYLGTQGGAKTLVVSSQQIGVNVLKQNVYGTASNGITKLYAQLLAAKINVASGSSSSPVASVIAAADAFLANMNHLNWSGLTTAQKNTVLSWHSTLDNYNNGLLGPIHCD